jgi:hypothetical protein
LVVASLWFDATSGRRVYRDGQTQTKNGSAWTLSLELIEETEEPSPGVAVNGKARFAGKLEIFRHGRILGIRGNGRPTLDPLAPDPAC